MTYLPDYLLDGLTGHRTVYVRVLRVNRAGDRRNMRFFMVNPSTLELDDVTTPLRELGGFRAARDGSLTVTGCGMDMVYHVLHTAYYRLPGASQAPTPPQFAYRLLP